MSEQGTCTIGETLAQLQPEFPDLTVSSLRFLEKEGLLQPQRSPGGHRLYGDEDIARIRLIKRLQSQRYYPLETIRHMLGKLERAKDIEAEMAFLESLHTPISYSPDFKPLSREELAESVGLSPADIASLEEKGLLFPHANGDGRRYYDEDDLRMAELVTRELLLGAVMDDFAHLGEAMRALVQEEFSLYRKLAGSDSPSIERARQLKETADLVHALLRAKLHRKMLQSKSK
ncbi:MAG: MerR family transcriptional regulator [Spirochaetaceae bacterium]|nr:MerR family transcriptional regulator [Spirochaetaceae bacterium]